MIVEAKIERYEGAEGKRLELVTRTAADVANDKHHAGGYSLYLVNEDLWAVIHRRPSENWTLRYDGGDFNDEVFMDLGTKRARGAIALINLLFDVR